MIQIITDCICSPADISGFSFLNLYLLPVNTLHKHNPWWNSLAQCFEMTPCHQVESTMCAVASPGNLSPDPPALQLGRWLPVTNHFRPYMGVEGQPGKAHPGSDGQSSPKCETGNQLFWGKSLDQKGRTWKNCESCQNKNGTTMSTLSKEAGYGRRGSSSQKNLLKLQAFTEPWQPCPRRSFMRTSAQPLTAHLRLITLVINHCSQGLLLKISAGILHISPLNPSPGLSLLAHPQFAMEHIFPMQCSASPK